MPWVETLPLIVTEALAPVAITALESLPVVETFLTVTAASPVPE